MPVTQPIVREEAQDPIRSRQAMMRAHALGAVMYYGVYDLSDPDQVAALREELGDAAVMPLDDGVYQLISVPSPAGPVRRCVPEGMGALECAVTAAAAYGGPAAAREVAYRVGVLPD